MENAEKQLIVLRKKDLKDPSFCRSWTDPENIATLTPEKVNAMLSNPGSESDEDPVQIVATRGGKAIGRLDLFMSRIRARGQDIPILWTSNLYVPQKYRSTLAGVLLVLKMQSLNPIVAACGVSQIALPLYHKLQWTDLVMPRHIMLLRSRSVVERFFGSGIKGKVAKFCADLALSTHRILTSPIRAFRLAGLYVERADQFPLDLVTAMESEPGGTETSRWKQQMEWMLYNSFETDSRNRKQLFLIRNRKRQVIAYFIGKIKFYESATHRGFRNLLLASLQDWRIFDREAISLTQLILISARVLSEWQPDAIEVCIPPDSANIRLKPWGFVRAAELHLLVKVAPKHPLNDQLEPIDKWSVRPADGDNIFS